MAKWFEASVRYMKMMEDGQEREACDKYLVEDETISCAEKRIVEEVAPYIHGDFEVESMTGKKIAEVRAVDGGTWYRAKVIFVTLDEKTGKEKKTASIVMVQAGSFEDALSEVRDVMKGTMADWYIAALQETPIVDVFSLNAEKE